MTPDDRARRARHRLSNELRRLRGASGKSGSTVAAATGMSQSKLAKIETQTLLPTVQDVEHLCAELGAPQELQAELVTLIQWLHVRGAAKRVVVHRGPHRGQHSALRYEENATTCGLFSPSEFHPYCRARATSAWPWARIPGATRTPRSTP